MIFGSNKEHKSHAYVGAYVHTWASCSGYFSPLALYVVLKILWCTLI